MRLSIIIVGAMLLLPPVAGLMAHAFAGAIATGRLPVTAWLGMVLWGLGAYWPRKKVAV